MQSRLNLTDEKKYLTANLTILQQRSSKHVVANTKNQLGGTLRSLYKRVPSLEQRKKKETDELHGMQQHSSRARVASFSFPISPDDDPFFWSKFQFFVSIDITHIHIYTKLVYTYIICQENRHIRGAHWLVCSKENRFVLKKCKMTKTFCYIQRSLSTWLLIIRTLIFLNPSQKLAFQTR